MVGVDPIVCWTVRAEMKTVTTRWENDISWALSSDSFTSFFSSLFIPFFSCHKHDVKERPILPDTLSPF